MRKLLCVIALAATFSGCIASKEQVRTLEEVAPYPAAAKGFQRHVIWLPVRANEELYRVQLIAGRNMLVDFNRTFLGGKLNEQSLQGWGYTYYQLEQTGGQVSTLMACPDSQKHEQFVQVQLDRDLLRYNSRLPLVVYIPAELELRYRIWQAPAALQQAPVQRDRESSPRLR